MRFAIFTHVEHTERDGRYYAYAPYVREMNLWLKHVEEVKVVGTRRRGDLQTGGLGGNGIAYEHSKLSFTEVPAFNLLNFLGAVKAIVKIPYIFFKMFGAMRRADHLHLRCPGNVGLLACICQIFFPSKSKSAKYAGNWDPGAKQPLTYRFQKWLLSNTFLTRNMQVLVYGEWPDQSKNIIPFFTASFSEKEKAEVSKKTFSEPFTFLFVGNLVEGKRPLEAVKLVQELIVNRRSAGGKFFASLEIYGDGPERNKLEKYVTEHELEDTVILKGSRPLEELKEAYQKAHFVILPSRSEGWPKAIAEGMFFGCIPIATPVSCVPWMLGGGSRGILISREYLGVSRVESGEREVESENQEPRAKNQDLLSSNMDKVELLLQDTQEMKRMSEAAKKWSQQYTLERFEGAIQEVLLNSNKNRVAESGKLSPAPFRGRGKTGKE
ncbi:glycosyltransferase [Salinimicrobium sp. CDJ15-81-2]|nr:glycosyltransferase [Salinimicrobium nanhaiense]